MGITSFQSHSSPTGELPKLSTWQIIVLLTLTFWLSSSLFLDLVVMPGMYATGMMATSDFASAGYAIFWLFNRVEILCAALVLTGVFALRHLFHPGVTGRWAIALAGVLMAIAITTTYGLSPEMSALGLQLDLFQPVEAVPMTMNVMHGGYFGLELLKLVAGAVLTVVCFRGMGFRNGQAST